MRIDCTIRGVGGDVDVAVTAPNGTPAARLREALRSYASVSTGTDVGVEDVVVGAVVRCEEPGDGVQPVSLRELHIVSGPGSGRCHPIPADSVVVGRDPSCDIRLDDADVSRRHVEVTVGPIGATAHDLGSTNGTSIDGRPITSADLDADAYLRVGDTVLALRPTGIPAESPKQTPGERVLHQPEQPRPVRRRAQWASVWACLGSGLLIAVLMRNPQFLLLSLASPLAGVAMMVSDRRSSRRDSRTEMARYVRRRREFEDEVQSRLRAERLTARARYPDPPSVCAALARAREWAPSRAENEDASTVRIGLGDQPSALQVRPATGDAQPAGVLPLVPVAIDVNGGTVALVGPMPLRRAMARWLLIQLALRQPPDQLRIELPHDPVSMAYWHWARWLPHVHEATGVHTVAVVEGDTRCSNDGRLSTIFLADSVDTLPADCRVVITPSGVSGARVTVAGSATDVVADQPGIDWCEEVARQLARLYSATRAGLPSSCRYSDVAGPDARTARDIDTAWSADDGSAATALGVGANGERVEIDLARNGPHALVAGTTGSGKSELLRTLIAGLAARHAPDALSFLLVDYKGGAAFAECASLPHVCGMLTDLDAADTARALTSLNAEILRRERLFAEVGAGSLESYRHLATAPPPSRLVVVVDEFATLAEELPDFVAGLVDVARRGRSLGIHLVLATQRPAGVVSAEIRANTSLRIALRTADDVESIDVIGTPAAARISDRTAGRAIVRCGAGLVDVQVAAVCGPAANSAVGVTPLGPWRSLAADDSTHDATELARLVDTIRTAALLSGRSGAASPWLQALPRVLPEWCGTQATRLPFAVIDRPAIQAQERLELDLATGGAIVIAGAAGSGRTTALLGAALRAAARFGPEQLEIAVFDSGGGGLASLRDLHQCRRYTTPSDPSVALTADELTRAVMGPDGSVARFRLALVDGWDAYSATSDAVDGGRSAEAVIRLLRAAAAGRLLMLVAGERSVLLPRITASASTVIPLRLQDPADYALVGIPSRNVPQTMPPGRGLTRNGELLQLVAPPEVSAQMAPPVSSETSMCG